MAQEHVGHYRIEELIGVGGMGEVYRAFDTRRERMVALKLLPEGLAKDPEFLRRFRRESHVAARLREPHVIPIHDYGEIDGRLFIDMRLVDGENLRDLLRRVGPLAVQDAVGVIAQVADALEAAHGDGLVHRDIKPSNVLVTPGGFVYVVDFGIARTVGTARTSVTITGVTVGTLDYMAPERFTNKAIDGRTDVYSLACLLFECLTAQGPFPGEDLPSLMFNHLYTDPPRPSHARPELPPAFDDVVARGMAKALDDRYPTPTALAVAAREALQGAPAPGTGAGTDRTIVSAIVPPAGPVPTPRPSADEGTVPHPGPGAVTGPVPAAPVEPAATTAAPDTAAEPAAPAEPPTPGIWPIATHTTDVPAAQPAATEAIPAVTADPAAAAATPAPAAEAAAPAPTTPAAPAPGTEAPGTGLPATPTAWPAAAGFPDDRDRTVRIVTGTPAFAAQPGAQPPTDVIPAQAGPVEPPADDPDRTVAIAGGPVPPAGPPPAVERAPGSGGRGRRIALIVGPLLAAALTAAVILLVVRPQGSDVALVPTGPAATDHDHAATTPTGAQPSLAQVPAAPAPSQSAPQVAAALAVPTVNGTIPVGPTPGYLEVAPNGRFAYIANRDAGVVTVLDTKINKVTATIPIPAGPPQFVAFSPDGSRAYVSIYNTERTLNAVGILDTSTNTLLTTIPVGKRPFASATTPDGKLLYVPSHDEGLLDVIDTTTDQLVNKIPVPPNPHWVVFSADGRTLYTANHESNVVSVLDVATNTVRTTIPVGRSPHSTALSPDGTRVAVVNFDSSTLSVIDTATNTVTATIPVGAKPQDVAFTPDGRYLYTANVDGNSVSVIDVGTSRVTATIPAPSPTSVSMLPNGRQAYVTLLGAGEVMVLDTTAG